MPNIRENSMDQMKVHIGTSGWSYKHWKGIFYPENVKEANYLEYYLTKFDCVELNSSFYHLPLKTTVAGWNRRTPENFIFCLKLSRYITHRQKLNSVEEPVERFFEVFKDLKNKTGPVLIQFPPGFHYNREKIAGFFDLLLQKYPDYRFAVEIRHVSWLTDDFSYLLEKNRMGFVIADSGNRFPSGETVTTDFVYLRFHGRQNLYAGNYHTEELAEYAEKIRNWNLDKKEIWVFFNNDIGGYAIRNALKLKEILKIV